MAKWLFVLLGLGGLVCAVAASSRVIKEAISTHSAMIFADQFDNPTAADVLRMLFSHHLEHSIVFPRLGYLADFYLVSGSNALNIGCIFVIQFVHVLLLGRLGRTQTSRLLSIDLIASSAALSLLFFAYQFENFFWGFSTQFVGVFAAATACFAVLFLHPARHAAIGWAIACGAVAAFTMANGVLALWIAALLAAVARMPRRQVAVLLVAAVVVSALFFLGYQIPVGHSSTEGRHDPLRVLQHLAIYLGAPIASLLGFAAPTNADPGWSVAVGLAGLALAAALGLTGVVRGRATRPAEWALSGVVLFVIGSAMLTGLGRFHFGFAQAASSRYGTPAAVFWCSLFLWSRLILVGRGIPSQLVSSSMGVAIAVLVLLRQEVWLRTAEPWIALRYAAETALLTGAPDEEPLRIVTGLGLARPDRIAALAEAHLSVFGREEASLVGSPLTPRFRIVAADACTGALERADLFGTGDGQFLRVSGWAWQRDRQTPVAEVLLTDAAGNIVGYARGPYRRPDVVRGSQGSVTDERVGWAGHARAVAATGLQAYGIIQGRMVCPLGNAVP